MVWYLVLRLAAFLTRRLPERWAIPIVRWLGRLIYRLSPLAAASRDNARHVLGPGATPERVSRVARQAFENRLLNLYDMLRLSGMPLQQVSSRTRIEGLEHLQGLLGQPHGVVVVSAHIGPMEFMIQAVAALGYPLLGITEHLQPERLHEFVIGLRSAHGLELISTQAPLLDVYRRVKRGEILLSAVDRDSTDTGLIVDFFGAPAWVPDGYARLAVRANVPVVFGFCLRTPEGAKGRVCPPVYPDRSLAREEATRDVIQRTVRLLEQAIRQDPAEWHLSTPIWQLGRERLERKAPG
jgi:KDO2-lipid IV(A) lauroyltransferase